MRTLLCFMLLAMCAVARAEYVTLEGSVTQRFMPGPIAGFEQYQYGSPILFVVYMDTAQKSFKFMDDELEQLNSTSEYFAAFECGNIPPATTTTQDMVAYVRDGVTELYLDGSTAISIDGELSEWGASLSQGVPVYGDTLLFPGGYTEHLFQGFTTELGVFIFGQLEVAAVTNTNPCFAEGGV